MLRIIYFKAFHLMAVFRTICIWLG